MMDFPRALMILLDTSREGRIYVNDPADPGGESKFGISKRAFPMEDIPSLTEARASFLYQSHFWGPAGCDTLPDSLRYSIFDLAVNSGPKRAIQLLQKAVLEDEDGILGPKTLQAVNSASPIRVLLRLTAFRMKFQVNLVNWPAESRGWTRRNAENLLLAANSEAAPVPPV